MKLPKQHIQLYLCLLPIVAGCSSPSSQGQLPNAKAPSTAEAVGDAADSQPLRKIVDELRAAGAPVDAEGWNTFYTLPSDLPDRTSAFADATAAVPRLSDIRNEHGFEGFLSWSGAIDKVPPPDQAWEELDTVQEHLRRNAESLKQVHAVLATPCAIRFKSDLRPYSKSRPADTFEFHATKALLRAHLVDRVYEKDAAGVAQCLLAMLRLNRAWYSVPDVEYLSLGLNDAALDLHSFTYGLSFGSLDETQLAIIAHELTQWDPETIVKRALIGTRALAFDALQQGDAYSLKFQNQVFGDPGIPELKAEQDWTKTRPEDAQHLLRLYQAAIDVVEQGLPEALEKRDAVLADLASIKSQPVATRDNLALLFSQDAVAALHQYAIIAGMKRCTAVAVDCERFRLNEARIPGELEELVPEYFESIPLDPYVPEKLHYREDGWSFGVYSYFKNGTDDDGQVGGSGPADLGLFVYHLNDE